MISVQCSNNLLCRCGAGQQQVLTSCPPECMAHGLATAAQLQGTSGIAVNKMQTQDCERRALSSAIETLCLC